MARDVEKEMESARSLSNGTMALWVVFDTDAEVEEAKEWMKGKRKVKTVEPMTTEESDKRKAKARKAIAKKLGIKG